MATQTIEVPIRGMDCAECSQHVQEAIAGVQGVCSVNVLLASEKAIVQLDPEQVALPTIVKVVERAGYSVPEAVAETPQAAQTFGNTTRL